MCLEAQCHSAFGGSSSEVTHRKRHSGHYNTLSPLCLQGIIGFCHRMQFFYSISVKHPLTLHKAGFQSGEKEEREKKGQKENFILQSCNLWIKYKSGFVYCCHVSFQPFSVFRTFRMGHQHHPMSRSQA